jgi:uncharacterized iron-regulated membrane protein
MNAHSDEEFSKSSGLLHRAIATLVSPVRAFFRRPRSVFVRRALFLIHRWIGIAAGLYVLVVCVTGAALVFRIDLQKAEYPHLFTPSAVGPLAEPIAIMNSVQAAFPDGRLSGIEAPTTVRPTYLAYVSKGSDFLTVLVDPVSARVLGLLPDRSWVRTLQDLHFDLLAGRTGRLVNGAGALLLLTMCVTGLVIWWPGVARWRRSLTIDVRRSWKRITWDLHSAVGIWTVAFTAMFAVTGAHFTFGRQIRAMVNWLSPLSTVSTPTSEVAGHVGEAPTWTALLETARARVPGQHVARVVTPFNESAAFLVMFSRQSPTPVGSAELTSVYLDRYTGAVLGAPPHGPRSAGDAVMAWMPSLHVGNFGGTGVRIAWVALGLAPPLLVVTGAVMFFQLRQRPNRLD